MRIKDTRWESNKAILKDLRAGEAFESGDSVYIKTDEATTPHGEIVMFNSVDLFNGKPTYFGDISVVIPLDAEIVISQKRRR